MEQWIIWHEDPKDGSGTYGMPQQRDVERHTVLRKAQTYARRLKRAHPTHNVVVEVLLTFDGVTKRHPMLRYPGNEGHAA